MGHSLKFNPAAVKALEGNSRIRLFTKTRAGETFFALRPSYRVSGKNVQLRVEPVEGEKFQLAELAAATIEMIEGLPALKNNTHYHLEDIGYKWFILKESDVDIDDKKPGVYVSKLREKAVKKVDETPPEDHDTTAETSAPASDDNSEPTILTTTAESAGETTPAADAEAEPAPAVQAASAKPKRVRPSRAKAKVDAPKADDQAETPAE